MDPTIIGKRITAQRRHVGLTQEALAEKLGVTPQAVSKWENGHNLPDMDNIVFIADILKMPYTALIGDEKESVMLPMRSRLFHETNMFTRVKTMAQTERLDNTLAALDFMREKHRGQYRNGSRYTYEKVEYINHPLMMACHAHAMGVKDDAILAAILLHDVVEDTDTTLSELPVSDEVKEIVDLVTFKKLPHMTREQSKAAYYERIMQNKKACVVKVIDRCNNVSTMAGSFKRDRLVRYITETEEYILPILTVLKSRHAEYSDLAFLVKYQIISLLESIKNLIV